MSSQGVYVAPQMSSSVFNKINTTLVSIIYPSGHLNNLSFVCHAYFLLKRSWGKVNSFEVLDVFLIWNGFIVIQESLIVWHICRLSAWTKTSIQAFCAENISKRKHLYIYFFWHCILQRKPKLTKNTIFQVGRDRTRVLWRRARWRSHPGSHPGLQGCDEEHADHSAAFRLAGEWTRFRKILINMKGLPTL